MNTELYSAVLNIFRLVIYITHPQYRYRWYAGIVQDVYDRIAGNGLTLDDRLYPEILSIVIELLGE